MEVTANQQFIINALAAGNTTVSEIAEVSGLSKQAVSANMKPLRDKGLITSNDEGKVVTYHLVAVQVAAIKDVTAPSVSKTVAKLKAVTRFEPEVMCNQMKRDNVRPRDIVQQLVAGGNITKKMAKGLVYDNKSL